MPVIESKLRKVPKVELTTPSNGMFNVYVDYWWTVTDDDCLLFYRHSRGSHGYGSPQCNAREAITRRVISDAIYPMPVHIEQIPVVYVPTSPEEYL